ncbi:hypothetical protein AK812_SmicGene34962 [Symbiodinium microadriaticum]|uniref:Uncharacterized protein n=1 Tax=Symbiodinium microadriaticum TaxID=2951 RepID=A0A1Q9CMP2_SYMMI|nr:hypothetical protein AK812_SmicGene34962 [Symbiodinium microadriaticum]
MLWESPRQRSQSGRACDHVPQGASSSADMTQINVAAMRGAKSKGRTRPKDHGDGERAQSPGAHDVGFDRWDRQLIVSCASGYHWKLEGAGHLRLSVSHTPSERSRSESDVLRARPVPRRRVPASQLEDGVWASTSQGYAYDKATCGKLNQSSDVTEITRAKAAEKDLVHYPALLGHCAKIVRKSFFVGPRFSYFEDSIFFSRNTAACRGILGGCRDEMRKREQQFDEEKQKLLDLLEEKDHILAYEQSQLDARVLEA